MVGLFVIAALMNNSGVPQQAENLPENAASKNLVTLDASTTMSDLLNTQKLLALQGIEVTYNQINFDPKHKGLSVLKLLVLDQNGTTRSFESLDLSTDPIIMDIDQFLNAAN